MSAYAYLLTTMAFFGSAFASSEVVVGSMPSCPPTDPRSPAVTISKRAQQFQDWLIENGFDLTVLELPDSTRSADDAARTLGCSKAQIIKSLVFRTDESRKPVLVLASGPNRVDEEKIARLSGSPVSKATPDFVKHVTGYSIGGVPPIGHPERLTTFVDEDLLKHDETWAAAGTPKAVFKISGPLTEILGEHTVTSIH